MTEIRLTKDNFKEEIVERNRLVGGIDPNVDLNVDLKDLFEGHITAEFNFNIIDVFKQHFRVHNLAVVSFRKDMIIVQTMTEPYTMPKINTKGLFTTLIPLSLMKEYDFDCNREEVNVIVAKTLLSVNFKSNCINVVVDRAVSAIP